MNSFPASLLRVSFLWIVAIVCSLRCGEQRSTDFITFYPRSSLDVTLPAL